MGGRSGGGRRRGEGGREEGGKVGMVYRREGLMERVMVEGREEGRGGEGGRGGGGREGEREGGREAWYFENGMYINLTTNEGRERGIQSNV